MYQRKSVYTSTFILGWEDAEKWRLSSCFSPWMIVTFNSAISLLRKGKCGWALILFSDASAALFEPGDLRYEAERDPSMDPSIMETTEKAIRILQKNPKGFFLLVESKSLDIQTCNLEDHPLCRRLMLLWSREGMHTFILWKLFSNPCYVFNEPVQKIVLFIKVSGINQFIITMMSFDF